MAFTAIALAQLVRYLVSPKVGSLPREPGEEDRGAFRVQTLNSIVGKGGRRGQTRFGVHALVTTHKLVLATSTSKAGRVLHVVRMLEDGEYPAGDAPIRLSGRRGAVTSEDVSVVGLDLESDPHTSDKRTPKHLSMTSPDAPRLMEALRASRALG